MKKNLNWEEFSKIDMRVGTIVGAQLFPEARKPAYKLEIDFGKEIGIKKTSAQITDHYKLEDLVDKQIIAVVNFPPKQIANFMSECLVLGSVDPDNKVILLQPERHAQNGDRVS
ncbi:tRNA-binding protein [Nonlabens sp. Hel1_33_55]|uniref:tRNA-binding protein n=1 Tax=Nonlabens sp. Hel1_33_55 TaxID=1336802 RepID=UPI000875B0D6|nr:tRNA-binding protein [Nonlabens sp. Hel1_33_55]SCX88155.1 tRNA-binding protein [Nonlabens sp. Hel1_33_55]